MKQCFVLKFSTKYSFFQGLVFLVSVGRWMIDLAPVVGRLLSSRGGEHHTVSFDHLVPS